MALPSRAIRRLLVVTGITEYEPGDARTGPGVWEPWMQDILDRIELKRGAHSDPWEGVCFQEAIALVTGQRMSDRPICVAGPYRNHGVTLNDRAPSPELRNTLKVFVPLIVNTHPLDQKGVPITGDEIEQKNAERRAALVTAFKGLNLSEQADWEKGREAYAKVLQEIG